MKTLQSSIHKAIRRRAPLSSITNAMRLVNGAGDDLDGLLIDCYDKHLHAQILSDHWNKEMPEICRTLTSCLPVEYLIVKSRRGLEIREEVLIGSRPQTIVEEYGIKFGVNLKEGLNCGLFLDMRHNRRMVGLFSKGKKVLNCFSYTCSFGLHARVGGACEVINVDISRKILERGENNYQLNCLPTAAGEFIKADSVSFLKRAFKKENYFDVVILDPPSFARYEGRVFQVKRDLPGLIASAVAVLNPGGSLLVTTNYSGIDVSNLEQMLARGLNGRRVAHIQRVSQDKDFIGSNSFKESYLVGVWVKFL